MDFGPLIPVMALAIPVIIMTGKFVIEPVIKGITQMTQKPEATIDTRLAERLAATEERLDRIERSLLRLEEAQDFHRQLQSPPRAG